MCNYARYTVSHVHSSIAWSAVFAGPICTERWKAFDKHIEHCRFTVTLFKQNLNRIVNTNFCILRELHQSINDRCAMNICRDVKCYCKRTDCASNVHYCLIQSSACHEYVFRHIELIKKTQLRRWKYLLSCLNFRTGHSEGRTKYSKTHRYLILLDLEHLCCVNDLGGIYYKQRSSRILLVSLFKISEMTSFTIFLSRWNRNNEERGSKRHQFCWCALHYQTLWKMILFLHIKLVCTPTIPSGGFQGNLGSSCQAGNWLFKGTTGNIILEISYRPNVVQNR